MAVEQALVQEYERGAVSLKRKRDSNRWEREGMKATVKEKSSPMKSTIY